MGKVYDGIDDGLREFILAQAVFFVATAPSGPGGHVNVSPKGMKGCLAVLGEHRVAYLDYTGSGAETIAHLRDNGRVTVMVCAFEGPPKVVRLHGQGTVVTPRDEGWDAMRRAFTTTEEHGLRSIIDVAVTRVSDSCGFSVPYLDYVGERDLLTQWAGNKTDAELVAYREKKNTSSIDGLPALA
jgi:Pyridoxamine 5'-phosphate oxidase